MTIIVEVETHNGDVVVARRPDGKYDVSKGGEIKHPECTAESAMRALAFYLQGAEYKISKMLDSSAK